MAAPLTALGLLLAAAAFVMTDSVFIPPDFVHHDETWLLAYLRNVSTVFSHITSLYSIGRSVQGRELWVLAIGHNAHEHVLLRPEIKLVGNIHGDEVVGREVLIHLIYHLVTNAQTDRSIGDLLRHVRIHILVSMNPDGYAVASASSEKHCFGVTGRNNARDFDLNRNFPDYFIDNSQTEIQPETQALMDWVHQMQFVLSVSLHGGALLANYPYDNRPRGATRRIHSDDNDVFQHLARLYSYSHPTMHRGDSCPEDHEQFPEGITTGESWYPVTGGMQDYNYIYAGCLELTVEMGCCKFPSNESELEREWFDHRDALLSFIAQATMGIKGVVKDARTGLSVSGAVVSVDKRRHSFKTTGRGEFWRLLVPGDYTIKFTAKGYKPLSRSVHVPPLSSQSQAGVMHVVDTSNRIATISNVYLEPVYVDNQEHFYQTLNNHSACSTSFSSFWLSTVSVVVVLKYVH